MPTCTAYRYIKAGFYDWGLGDFTFARSTDSGTTWSASTIDSSAVDVGFQSSLAIYDPTPGATTKTDTVVAPAWVDTTNSDIKFAKSTDSGTSFGAAIIVDNGSTGTTVASPARSS